MLNPTDEIDVEFTQSLFPTGRKVQRWIARPKDVALKAQILNSLGFKFEIENDDERIWMTCINHRADRYVDKFCVNGVDVPVKVDELINDAYDKFVKG